MQKLELGLLDPDWEALPDGFTEADLDDPEAARGRITLDTEEDRDHARRMAEAAVVLLANDGTLPIRDHAGKRILVVGPTAADSFTLLGCYSFPSHVGSHAPRSPDRDRDPDGARRPCTPSSRTAGSRYMQGVSIDGDDASGIEPSVVVARRPGPRHRDARRPCRAVRPRDLGRGL